MRNRPVQLLHFLLGGCDFGRIRGQKIAALDGAEIGREVVEIAENARVGQPQLGNVRGQPIEMAQPGDAERAKDDDQQEKEQKDRSKLGSD